MFAFLFTLSFAALASDPPEIEAIRANYQSVSALITDGQMVRNQVKVNADSASWPATGTYGQTLDFYYAWKEEAHGLQDTPIKVVHSAEVAAYAFSTELLFSKGQLVFAFTKRFEAPDEVERRFYFHDGKPLRVMVGTQVHDVVEGELAEAADKLTVFAAQALRVAGHIKASPVDPLQ
jgi:hypothetical protein